MIKITSEKIKSRIIKGVILLCLIVTMIQSAPRPAHAIWGVGDTTFIIGDVSPSGISNWSTNVMGNLKDYVLDHLATLVAKQILHQMTVATINWINSGFDGSPAFLTNPSGFLLDTADQITGGIIMNNGPLQGLCSPWNVDVRLSLALLQTQPMDQRYGCTLSTLIDNAKNTSVNGQSIQGFLGGDFSQGGWPAFISLSTEPQNNPYGSYLQAHSDVLSAIEQRKAAIGQDLQQGGGFMSWQDCEDVQSDSLPPSTSSGSGESDFGRFVATSNKDGTSQSAISQKPDGSGSQKCTVKTPGSVIANALKIHTDSGVVELELANSINSVVNALVSQLVSQMLSKGLGALSSGGSGVSGSGQNNLNSYTSQLQADAAASKSVSVQGAGSNNNSSASIKSAYDQAISIITDSKNSYMTAFSCLANKGNGSRFEIDTIITSKIDPLLASLTAKQVAAISQTGGTQSNINVSGTTDIRQLTNQQTLAIDTAKTDLEDARAQAETFETDAARYQAICDAP